MEYITVPKNFVWSGRYMFSHRSRCQNESKQPWGSSLALRRKCVIEALCMFLLFIIHYFFYFYFFIFVFFLLKKFQPQIILNLFLFFERFQPQCSC